MDKLERIRQRIINQLGNKYINEDRGLTEKELNDGYENRYTLELLLEEYDNALFDE